MTVDLSGAVVCVTGGARGIGRATARALAECGALVWIGDLDPDLTQETAKQIGPAVHAMKLDVAEQESFSTFIETASATGPIAMLVNNAGFMRTGQFSTLEIDGHSHEIAVNLTGVVRGTHLVLPGMLNRNYGHIVNVASMAAKFTVPGAAVYTATKAGVAAFSAAVRGELIGTNITVTTILPAAVRTDLTAGVRTDMMHPVEPETIAAAIVKSARTGRPETSIPRLARHLGIVEEVMPERPWNTLKRLLGAEDRLITDDPRRLGYQDRQRRQVDRGGDDPL